MRFVLSFLLLTLVTNFAWSQSDTITNSFEQTYKELNPGIKYKYISEKQTHDYSNNWDLDKDGKNDEVYFIGTGGAHLYYFLRVILSSDNITRDFPFIESDLPILPREVGLQKPFDIAKTNFTVFDYNKETDVAIFIKLDRQSFVAGRTILKKKGINTNLVMISFKNGKTLFQDFKSHVDSSNLFEMKKGILPSPIVAPSNKLKVEINRSSDSIYCAMYQMDSSYLVVAIFDGLVVTSEVVGLYYQVTTKFGDYFITYDLLNKPLVKRGDFVKAGQTISTVGDNLHGTYFFNFFISDSKNSLNPLLWLKH